MSVHEINKIQINVQKTKITLFPNFHFPHFRVSYFHVSLFPYCIFMSRIFTTCVLDGAEISFLAFSVAPFIS